MAAVPSGAQSSPPVPFLDQHWAVIGSGGHGWSWVVGSVPLLPTRAHNCHPRIPLGRDRPAWLPWLAGCPGSALARWLPWLAGCPDSLVALTRSPFHIPSPTIMTRFQSFSIDLGNRFLKYRAESQRPHRMLSAIAEVVAHSRPNLDPTTSALLEYLDGAAPYVGQRWVVGESARESTIYSNTVSLPNKATEALRLILAPIAPTSPADTEISIDRLYITLPDPDQDGAGLRQLVQGTHHIRRNGQELTVTFGQVVVCAEAVAGFHYALKRGVVKLGQLNGVLDLGGGTAIGALFNRKGQEIQDARAVLRKSGVFALAACIATNREMTALTRGAAAIDRILDGMERQDFRYGNTGHSFQTIFEAHYPIWIRQLMNELLARWDAYTDDLGVIAVIGGSAPLAEPFIQSTENRWFQLCPNSQYANVLGVVDASRNLVAPGV